MSKKVGDESHVFKILRSRDLAVRLGVSQSTVWRWAKDATLPEPIKIGRGVTGWRSEVIEKWLEDKSTPEGERIAK